MWTLIEELWSKSVSANITDKHTVRIKGAGSAVLNVPIAVLSVWNETHIVWLDQFEIPKACCAIQGGPYDITGDAISNNRANLSTSFFVNR